MRGTLGGDGAGLRGGRAAWPKAAPQGLTRAGLKLVEPPRTLHFITDTIHCRGPASAGSRGTLRMNGVGEKKREKTRETSLDRAKSARERERERENDQTGVFAGSGRVWQIFIFYCSFIF